MRKASRILGIVGGSISLLVAVIFLLVGIFAATFASTFLEDLFNSDFYDNLIEYENLETYEFEDFMLENGNYGVTKFLSAVVITIGIVFLIFALLGIIGGAIVDRSPILAAVFMLVSGMVSFVTGIGVLSGFMLILGGIFAFIKDKKDDNNEPKELSEAIA